MYVVLYYETIAMNYKQLRRVVTDSIDLYLGVCSVKLTRMWDKDSKDILGTMTAASRIAANGHQCHITYLGSDVVNRICLLHKKNYRTFTTLGCLYIFKVYKD